MKVGYLGGMITANRHYTANSITGKTDVNFQGTDDNGLYGAAGYSSDTKIITKAASTPAADPFPWKWSWNAKEQFAGNTTYAFGSTVGTDGYGSGTFIFSANSGYGIRMEQDDTAMHGAAYPPWFNINEEHMTKQDGTSLISGALDDNVVSDEGGRYLTVVYSGYIPGSGYSSSDIGYGTLYWASENKTLSYQDITDYSAVVNIANYNIEGDLVYVTYDMNGSEAPRDGTTALDWEAAGSDPRSIIVSPWGDVSGHVAIDTEITLRGIIIWSDKDAVAGNHGNTNITMPIRTS